jgi:hypothetical protein
MAIIFPEFDIEIPSACTVTDGVEARMPRAFHVFFHRAIELTGLTEIAAYS